MKEKEKRIFFADTKLRSSSQDIVGEKILEGHAAVFNQTTNIGGAFNEVIRRGAFDGCDMSDVALFVNHDTSKIPLARTTSGTLSVSIDEIGLKIRAKLDVEKNSDAMALYSAVERGDVKGMSFAFVVADDGDEWLNLETEMPTRIIHKIARLIEVSSANYPAYVSTDIQARAKQTLTNARKYSEVFGLEEMLREMEDRRAALIRQSNTSKNSAELKAINQRIMTLDREIEALRSVRAENPNEDMDERTAAIRAHMRQEEMQNETRGTNPPKYIPSKGFVPAEERKVDFMKVTQQVQAGEDLKERRAVESAFNIFGERRTLTVQPIGNEPASIVVPKFSSENINEGFPVVSSLVDAVAHLSLHGGESFSQPYVESIASGGYTQEGEDYNDAATVFNYAQLNRVKLTAYAELTEELEKLPAAAYADLVFQNIRVAIRKALTREILFGAGISDNQNRIVGIFSEKATAIDPASDLSFSEITDTTLSEILYRYGGEETVESASCLVLNKLDLLAFANVRTSTKLNYYDIQYNGNGVGGKINGVNFIIDSACKPLTGADTQSGDYCMCYGNLSNYLIVEFSPLEIRRSDDYKFRKGIACFRGSSICGGNVVRHNGFIRVKKK